MRFTAHYVVLHAHCRAFGRVLSSAWHASQHSFMSMSNSYWVIQLQIEVFNFLQVWPAITCIWETILWNSIYQFHSVLTAYSVHKWIHIICWVGVQGLPNYPICHNIFEDHLVNVGVDWVVGMELIPIPTMIAAVSCKVWQIPEAVCVVWVPDDGRRNRLKHVEHFMEINKLRSVASCWLHFGNMLKMQGLMNIRYSYDEIRYTTPVPFCCITILIILSHLFSSIFHSKRKHCT
jgi:hypothetical protein